MNSINNNQQITYTIYNKYAGRKFQMFLDQAKYDKTLSYDLNKRRREDVERGRYEDIVRDDRRESNRNYALNKPIKVAEVRMSMEELRMRILYDESVKRRKLRLLFDADM